MKLFPQADLKIDGLTGRMVKIGRMIGGTNVTDACFEDACIVPTPPFDDNTCMDRDGEGGITTNSKGFVALAWDNMGGADTNGGVGTAVDECVVDYSAPT